MNQQHPSGQTKDESIEKENRSWRNERTDKSKDLQNSLNSTEANKTDANSQSSNVKGRGHPRFRQNNPDSIDNSTSWDAGPRPPQDSRNSRRTTSSDDRPSQQQIYSNSNSRRDMMSQNRRGGGFSGGLHNRKYDSQSTSSDARHQFGQSPQRTKTTENRQFKKEPSSLQAGTEPSTGDRTSSSQSASSDTRRSSGRGRVSIFAKGLVMKHLHQQPGLKTNGKSSSMKNESTEGQDLPGEHNANSAVQEGPRPDEEPTKRADAVASISQAQHDEENTPSDSDPTLEPENKVPSTKKLPSRTYSSEYIPVYTSADHSRSDFSSTEPPVFDIQPRQNKAIAIRAPPSSDSEEKSKITEAKNSPRNTPSSRPQNEPLSNPQSSSAQIDDSEIKSDDLMVKETKSEPVETSLTEGAGKSIQPMKQGKDHSMSSGKSSQYEVEKSMNSLKKSAESSVAGMDEIIDKKIDKMSLHDRSDDDHEAGEEGGEDLEDWEKDVDVDIPIPEEADDTKDHEQQRMGIDVAENLENTTILQVYEFPTEWKESDIISIFKPIHLTGGYVLEWRGDDDVLVVFDSPQDAKLAYLNLFQPFPYSSNMEYKIKPYKKRLARVEDPNVPRPKTSSFVASRLISSALGVKNPIASEKKQAHKEKLREARDQRALEKAKEEQRQKALDDAFNE